MLRSSLTALTAAALTATALAQHTPVAPAANLRPPRPFVRALSEGGAVWADGTLGPVETDRSVGSAAPGDGTTLQGGIARVHHGLRHPRLERDRLRPRR